MKRYILEIDRTQIWSYEADNVGSKIKYTLMKSHGEKTYWLEDGYEAYWTWFEKEISLLSETEVDVCFLYDETAKNVFSGLIKRMPNFKKPTDTSWRLSELQEFLRSYRDNRRTEEPTYQKDVSKFHFADGQTLCIGGTGNFHIVEDAPKDEPQQPTAPKPQKDNIAPTPMSQPPHPLSAVPQRTSKKPKIKVYGPDRTATPANSVTPKESPADNKETIGSRRSTEKTTPKWNRTLTVEKKEPTEKVGADDLQRFFQQKTEGQCDTVLFPSEPKP